MTTVVPGSDGAIRMDANGEAGAVAVAVASSSSSSQVVFDTGGGTAFSATGGNFTFSASGAVAGGTVTAVTETVAGAVSFSVSGVSIGLVDLGGHFSYSGDDGMAALFAGDDVLTGTALNDVINGYAGNNTISGGGGADVLLAGNGNNHIWGAAAGAPQGTADGADVIVFGNGTNYVNGNAGSDVITGGNGANRAYGGAGDDVIALGNGNNQVNGNTGNDVIHVGTGNNVVRGGQGNDVIVAGNGLSSGNNVLMGDAGDDVIVGGGGYDLMTGGTGADLFHVGGAASHAVSIGGQAYLDEITDFAIGTDRLAMDGFAVDRIVSGTAANATAAHEYAVSLLGQANDPHAVAAIGVGTDTLLFFRGSDAASAIDGVVRLDGVTHSDTLTVANLFG